MLRHLRQHSNLKNCRSLSTVRKKRSEDNPIIMFEKHEVPASLLELESTRRSLISLIQRNTSENITTETIEELRKTSLPKEYRDFIIKKNSEEKKKQTLKLLSRSPIDTAVYQIRSLSRNSRWKLGSELTARVASEVRFKALAKLK